MARSQLLRPRVALRVALWVALVLVAQDFARADAGGNASTNGEMIFCASERGDVGVFQISPVFSAQNAPALPREDTRWTVVQHRMGTIDLNKPSAHADAVAFAKVDLVASEKGRYVALLGVDDGVSVIVDGRPVYSRDEARPYREDDDFVPLDLDAGRHTILFRLHQRDGAWLFHARFTGADLRASPALRFRLPASLAKTDDLLALSSVTFDRGLGADGFHPRLHVEFPAGLPEDVDVPLHATLANSQNTLFSSAIGAARTKDGIARSFDVALPALAATDVDEHARLELDVGPRHLTLPIAVPPEVVAITARAHAMLRGAPHDSMSSDALASVAWIMTRIERYVRDGDTDTDALRAEAKELALLVDAGERGEDPYAKKTGAMRRAYVSPIDSAPAELGLYVPRAYNFTDHSRKWPLIVALHGMDGLPMAMMRWLFGFDEPKKDQSWEERHAADLPPLDAIVVAPDGFGNTMYRELGEDDVLQVIEWAKAHYSIDDARVTITGPSMGGIGAASIPLHHPDLFAAAAPLCGYHSYFLRRDIGERVRRPWEQSIAEERSNVMWAENGAALPLFVVHGQRDLPVENSSILVDRYNALHFHVEHEEPDLGHNVWQTSYENLKLAKWLVAKKRAFDFRNIDFKTTSTRNGDVAWMHIDALDGTRTWAHVTAHARANDVQVTTTANVRALHLDALGVPPSPSLSPNVIVDHTPLAFEDDEPRAMHREDGVWKKGAAPDESRTKHGHVTGPIRDVFHEPIVFVYGTQSADGAAANEAVARGFAAIRGGIDVHYPIMSDASFLAAHESLEKDRALFLVGNAKENALVAMLDDAFPIHVEGDHVRAGEKIFSSEEAGAMFIRPNPKHPSSYVVVVEAPTPLGTMRALSLPDMLPDFVVYDRFVAPSRHQLLLGAGSLLAGGIFTNEWSLPKTIDDPFAQSPRKKPQNEHDATPYLP